MKKNQPADVWNENTETNPAEAIKAHKAMGDKVSKAQTQPNTQTPPESEPLYDLEGLMTDFPTAKELEKFVYDQTGYVLNLKGRSNKFKYQTAMDVLNGQEPADFLTGNENPYLDKNDIIPVDKLREHFTTPDEVRGWPMVSFFQSRQFPHPDPDWKAAGQKCDIVFKKYANNVITYEIIGPIATRPVGVRVNKFGKEVPEKYTWVDPRTGEQVLRDESGRYTPIGTRLRAAMQKQRVNNTNWWAAWIDRDFIIGQSNNVFDDPWGTTA